MTETTENLEKVIIKAQAPTEVEGPLLGLLVVELVTRGEVVVEVDMAVEAELEVEVAAEAILQHAHLHAGRATMKMELDGTTLPSLLRSSGPLTLLHQPCRMTAGRNLPRQQLANGRTIAGKSHNGALALAKDEEATAEAAAGKRALMATGRCHCPVTNG